VSPTATARAAGRPPFQHFLDAHRGPVLAFLRAMVGRDDAEDCFQETFIAALRAYDGMDGAHPRAWVMTIARRKAIDHHRARARRPEPREDVPELVAPAANGRLGDLDGAVWAAVAELGEGQRAAVALRYAGDLGYREIAAIQQVSVDTIKAQMLQARKKLRELLDEHFSDIDF
jgi:RNA polymerase sigma factor (sigma-70 family)